MEQLQAQLAAALRHKQLAEVTSVHCCVRAHTLSLSLTAHLFASLPFVYLLVPSAIVSLVLWDVVWAST